MKKQPEKSSPPLSVEELARCLNCPFEGDGSAVIRGVSSLEKAQKGDLVFLSHRKYLSLLEQSKASAAIIPSEERYDIIPVIKSENPHISFVKAVEIFYKPYRPPPGIHPSALVSPSAKIGKDVTIGPFAFIGDEAEIGAETVIFPFVAIYP
ncbi:MAG TPA: UDP-3-O-(3-hydroxymyristoyl)glucosamine N-acyltransferase, partial [Candidatus Aminicenantes bacterium]|nr:UDP-3-O-(3-hydroxymyristoyl)glucosamine N-acyltransferase [Candidatus Aminicenantes bacterium]